MSDPLSSGVSNGDVDWVFRGKAKKLTKKMLNDMPSCIPKKELEILQKRQNEPSAQDGDVSPTSGGPGGLTGDSQTPSTGFRNNHTADLANYPASPALPSPSTSSPIPIPAPTKSSLKSLSVSYSNTALAGDHHQHPLSVSPKIPSHLLPSKSNSSVASNASSASVASTSSVSSSVAPGTSPSSTSKLFKLGRLRSTSNPVTPLSSQTSSGPGAALGTSPGSPSALNSNANPVSIPKRNSVSEGVKRSFFGSISSKFSRQSSVSSQELTTSNASASMGSSSIGPITEGVAVESHPNEALKLNPNHLGDSTQSQDLSKLNKLPQGMGVGRRKSTLSQSDTEQLSRKNSASRSHHSTQSSNHHHHHHHHHHSQKADALAGVSLVRVCFAVDQLAYDPQQQIPSRKPRKGNVLIPEDIMAPPPRLSQGISVANAGLEKKLEEKKYSQQEIAVIIENHRRAMLEAESHAHEAHLVAKKVAAEVGLYKCSKNGLAVSNSDPFEDEIELNIKEIDKPIHVHEKNFEGEEIGPDDENESDESSEPKEATLEQVYTRCCHLREILPIPATLKQLKNKLKPLQVLKLLNPRPTLIDVLSFLDFIAVTPINTIIFDNVTMTTEMFKHLLGSLVSLNRLEKLSLRNVPIDAQGWLILCKFLQQNKSLRKLDISQQRLKTSDNSTLRSKMNWDLFFLALKYRGGMPELVLNGCKLSDSMFEQLINTISLATLRLGIALTELNASKFKLIIDWVTAPESKCVGLDIGFNDLSPHVGYMLSRLSSHINDTKLLFLSLNSTNLEYTPETVELMKNLAQVKTIRFLDLSSNPRLFPKIIPYLSKYLPKFSDLRRIHFDLNELSPKLIAALANILPHIPPLVHVSFLGNRELTESAAAIIYTALKELRSIFALDLDYDLIPDALAQRIAFYLMRNMQYTVVNHTYASHIEHEEDDEELMYDGSIMMETAEKLLNEKGKADNPKVMRILNDAIIERTLVIRKKIHNNIDLLLAKKETEGLTSTDSDVLLKYCILDASLDNVFTLFKDHATMNNAVSLSPSISMDESNSTKGENNGAGFTAAALANAMSGNSSRPGTSPTITNRHPAIASIIGDTAGATGDGDANSKPSSTDQTDTPPVDTAGNQLNEDLSNLKILVDGAIQTGRARELLSLLPILYPRISDVSTNPQIHVEPPVIPHDVVTTHVDGQEATIDNMTGRPVLMRSLSQTSEHDRELKEEEGEMHKREFHIKHRMLIDEQQNK